MPLATAKSFILALLPSWLISYLLASICHTQMVLYALSDIGVTIPVADRLRTTVDDVVGLLAIYGSATGLSLFLAFLLVTWLNSKFRLPVIFYPVAGAMAIFIMLMAMYPIMHVTLIAGARSSTGLALQCLAGFIGGIVFIKRYK